MPGKILFIHGFASCSSGNKAELLKQHFGQDRLLSPDLPIDPGQSIEILRQIIEQHDPVLIISSSLGSFYTTCLNTDNLIPAVLINPAVHAADTLAPHVGEHTHWCTDEKFFLTEDHIDQLRNMQREQIDPQEKYLVLLQSGDEVLDYRDAAHFYQGQDIIIEQGGNHRFENLETYLNIIDGFLAKYATP